MKTLRELYQEHDGKVSDKWDIYLDEYSRILSPYRDKEINLLEIGIQNGGSLEIWNNFFPNARNLIGCDINEDCGKLEYESPHISIVVGNANTDLVEKQISSISNQFDIVIDDGSHTSEDIVLSFEKYFPYIKEGGVFIAEDLHCSYWKSFGGGLYDLTSSISFFKQLVDIINYEHWGLNRSIEEALVVFNQKYGLTLNLDVLESIHSIEFVNSLCIVRKENAINNRLGCRNIAGTEELVVKGHGEHEGSYIEAIPQDETDEDSISPLLRINFREEKIKNLNERQYLLEAHIDHLNIQELELKNKIDNLESVLNEIQAERDQHQSDVIKLEENITKMISSKSWRITRPLRGVASSFNKLYKPLSYPVSIVKVNGGIGPVINKLLNIYKSEGIKGVARKCQIAIDRSKRNDFDTDQNYAKWILRYDALSPKDKEKISDDIESFKNKSLISIVMPVYNPDINWLSEAISSIKAQLYRNWELCIADDNSTNPLVRKFLEEEQAKDDRIKITFRQQNGHISLASNSALDIASGEWIALMDQDDLLPEHALYWVAKSINNYPDAGLFYSDEDKIDVAGIRHSPYFKCDWNRSLFYSQNMICHLGIYKSNLVRKVGGFIQGLEGAQDHDLALRISECLQDEQIIHIPKVLYHWRVHPQSTASGASAKPYASIAGVKAIKSHLDRTGVNADVTSNPYGYRVKYHLPETPPKVSLIIPTRNKLELVKTCIESILNKTTYPDYEIILVDNGSDNNDCLKYFTLIEERYDNVIVKHDPREFNYSALNNDAVKMSQGEIIGLINNDIEVIDPDWLSEMVGQVIQPGVGAVGAKLLYPNNLIQHAGVVIGYGGVAGHAFVNYRSEDPGYFNRLNIVSEYSAVTAACLIVKRSDFDAVKGLNENDLKVAFNDIDFCLKLKKLGRRNVWTPYAKLYHNESASRGYEDNVEKISRFNSEIKYMQDKWDSYIKNDPCYSLNLSLTYDDFRLSWPPRTS